MSTRSTTTYRHPAFLLLPCVGVLLALVVVMFVSPLYGAITAALPGDCPSGTHATWSADRHAMDRCIADGSNY